jgi:hypothetical protein
MARRWPDAPMAWARWVLPALGAVAVAVAFPMIGDVTTGFSAGMAAGFGVLVWGVSERIIVSTRSRPETRLATARQGAIER